MQMRVEAGHPVPLTLPDVIERIEQLFDCRDGPYQSYVVHNGLPYSYVSLGWLGKSDRSHNDANIVFNLRGTLFGQFFDLAAPFAASKIRPVLYWRFAAEARIEEEVQKRRKYYMHKIRTRVAIPDCTEALMKIGLPEGSMYPEIPL